MNPVRSLEEERGDMAKLRKQQQQVSREYLGAQLNYTKQQQ
jgi:hypothetical protein